MLQQLLEERGVDVVRSGYDLLMPSPFKERVKRKAEPGYVDHQRRLSVTVVENDGQPVILWQCWYTKRPDGKPFGGKSAYAIAVRTGMPQKEVLERLNMRFDAEVAAQDEAEDKALVIRAMAVRDKEVERQRLLDASWVLTPGAEQLAKAKAAAPAEVARNRPAPPSCAPLFGGLTPMGDTMVLGRNIRSEVARDYGLCWDFDAEAVMMPWRSRSGEHVTHVWYNPEWQRKAYRFPPREPGVASKENAIFGIDRWRENIPLTLCEGTFDALTLMGCALGGSSLTDAQKAILVSLSPAPSMIILALDKDGAGVSGAMAISRTLKTEMPNTRVLTVFPPAKDWNQIAQDAGADQALRLFVERVRDSERDRGLVATVRQIALHR